MCARAAPAPAPAHRVPETAASSSPLLRPSADFPARKQAFALAVGLGEGGGGGGGGACRLTPAPFSPPEICRSPAFDQPAFDRYLTRKNRKFFCPCAASSRRDSAAGLAGQKCGRGDDWSNTGEPAKAVSGRGGAGNRTAPRIRQLVKSATGHFGNWSSRQLVKSATGQFGNWSSRQLVKSVTGQVGNWSSRQLVRSATGQFGNWSIRQLVKSATGQIGNWSSRQLGDCAEFGNWPNAPRRGAALRASRRRRAGVARSKTILQNLYHPVEHPLFKTFLKPF